jgi:outer membrane protein assembly factor BamB
LLTLLALAVASCSPAPSASPPSHPGTPGVTVYVGAQPSGHSVSVYALQGSTGSIHWHVQTDGVFPGLALVDGVVYATDSRLSGPSSGGAVSAFRASDGSRLWHSRVTSAGLAAPLVANGMVYLVSNLDGMVYALRASDGSRLWQRQISQGNGSFFLIVADDMLAVANTLDGVIWGLRASDGSRLWQVQTGYQEVAAPQVAGGVLYIVGTNQLPDAGGLLAVRMSDGSVLWRYQVKKATLLAPLLSGTAVYISVDDGLVLALRSSDGSRLWQTKTPPATLVMPQMAQGVLYVAGGSGNTVSALHMSDGSLLWQRMIGGAPGLSSLQVASGVMYVADIEGMVSALKGSDGSLLWQRALSGAGVGSMPSPIQVAGGMLYLVDSGDGSVYGLRASDGSIRWHVMTGQPDPAVRLPLVVSV